LKDRSAAIRVKAIGAAIEQFNEKYAEVAAFL
jgi:hypothetical protein